MIAPGSAHGQDAMVLSLLEGMRDGFFLDSGASDGLTGSNSWRLETEYGWSGICVEPNPAFFAALVANRGCLCVNCCLYTHDGRVDFVEAGVLGGIASHHDPCLVAQARRSGILATDAAGEALVVERPARTVRSILDEHEAPRTIDYWSLDTEGSELAILESFPFDRYDVRIITVEHNFFPVREEIRAFLEARGYRRIAPLHVDDCYGRGLPAAAASWRSGAWRR